MPFDKQAFTLLALLLVALAAPSPGTAQEEVDETLYVELDCMKSSSADYAEVESEIWRPIHQERVKKGKLAGWALYSVLYGSGSDCDHYTINSYRGLKQLNADKAFAEHFAAAHPGRSWEEALERTLASRTHASSQLWVRVDGIPPAEHRFVEANRMHAADGPAYVDLELQTWKPVHQKLVDDGQMAGWSLYRLVSPHGSAIPYNYQTINFLQRIGPLPVAEAMRAVHPGDAPIPDATELRDHLLGEIWELVASTE